MNEKSSNAHNDFIYKQIERLDTEWQIELQTFSIELKYLILTDFKFSKTTLLYILPLYILVISIIDNDVITIRNIIFIMIVIFLSVAIYRRNKHKESYKSAKMDYEEKRNNLLNQFHQ